MNRRERRHRKRQRKQHPVERVLGLSVLLAVCGLVLGAAGVVTWVLAVADSAPNINQLHARSQGQLSEVYAGDGQLLGYLSSDILRTVLPQAQQPRLMREATVAIEDRRFYQHGGVDYTGLIRAAVRDIFHNSDEIQGGSTLTMQLVKNEYQKAQVVHNIKYKIIQAKLAIQLEREHTKDWILTQYLNDIPYGTVGGQGVYGIGAAAQVFFDKPIGKLNLAQYALLAGLPQAPSAYDPFSDPRIARQRRAEVLRAMVVAGYITRAQARRANRSKLQVKRNTTYQAVRQPYVFDYVRQQLLKALPQSVVDAGGLKVYTTIDLADQAYAQQALMAHEGAAGDPAAALATVDPANGHILAIAQNTAYGTKHGDTVFDYATNAQRQTGSSFKTFVLMTLIHDYNGDPNTTYYDSSPLPAGWLPAYPTYSVHNAEAGGMGKINVTMATTDSVNAVYAQLGVDLGMDKVDAMAHAMGVTAPLYGFPAEAIGGLKVGVSPLQMADAYATIDNGGIHHKPTIIAKVVLPGGRTIDLGNPAGTRVFTPAEAYEGTQVLRTVIESGTGTPASYGCPAAGKTGTTSNYTDAWFVGFEPQLSTAVWVGYPNATTSMTDVNGLGPGFGGTLAAPIWRDYMAKAAGGYCGDFTAPPGGRFVGKPFVGAHSTAQPTLTTATQTTTTGAQTSTTGTTTTPTKTGTGTTPAATTTTPHPTTPPGQGGGHPPGNPHPGGGPPSGGGGVGGGH